MSIEHIKREIFDELKKKNPSADPELMESFWENLIEVSGTNPNDIRQHFRTVVRVNAVVHFLLSKLIPGILLFFVLQWAFPYE